MDAVVGELETNDGMCLQAGDGSAHTSILLRLRGPACVDAVDVHAPTF